jgi:hypothetical protein
MSAMAWGRNFAGILVLIGMSFRTMAIQNY